MGSWVTESGNGLVGWGQKWGRADMAVWGVNYMQNRERNRMHGKGHQSANYYRAAWNADAV